MQAQTTTRVHPIGIPVVSEEQARENMRRQRDAKAARKAAKALQARKADEAREERRREREAAEAAAKAEAEAGETVVATPVVPSKVGVIVSLPTPEELDRRAADLIRFEPERPITEKGLRLNVNVAIQYIGAWLAGSGAVLLDCRRPDDPEAMRLAYNANARSRGRDARIPGV